MKIVTVDEMRALETRAAQEYGLTSQILMENAGRSAAEILARYIAEKDNARPLDELAFLVLVGLATMAGGAWSWRPTRDKGGGISTRLTRKDNILPVRDRRTRRRTRTPRSTRHC